MKPQRVQLSRKRGWKMPPNTVSVARPTMFGNPFKVEVFGLQRSLALFGDTAQGFWSPGLFRIEEPDSLVLEAYRAHTEWRKRVRRRTGGSIAEAAQAWLRGKNLACWCPLDKPCHADVLLEIANR